MIVHLWGVFDSVLKYVFQMLKVEKYMALIFLIKNTTK